VSGFCSELGLKMFAEFFTDYSVGDYSGCIQQIKRIWKTLSDPEERAKAFSRVFAVLFAIQVKDPARRAEMRREIDQLDQRTQEEAAAATLLRNAQAQAAAMRAAPAATVAAPAAVAAPAPAAPSAPVPAPAAAVAPAPAAVGA